SRHGRVNPDESVCISEPLSGADCAAGVPSRPANTPLFYHYSVEVGSYDSLRLILDTFDRTDFLGQASWSEALREDSFKIFVEITDDESDISASAFEEGL